MSVLQLAVVLTPTALQLVWLRHVGAIRGHVRQAARVMACGAASAVAAGTVGTLARCLLGTMLPEGTFAWQVARCFLCVGLVEELCKLRAARRGSDRQHMEVVLSCVLAAMGFDLVENLGYSMTATMGVSVMRSLTSVARHVLCGIIMGAMLGKAEQAEKRGSDATSWHMASIAAPTALHGLYDLCLYALPSPAAFAFVLAYGVAGTVAALRLVGGLPARDVSSC